MQKHVDRVLISRDAIAERVGQMAEQIADDFRSATGPAADGAEGSLSIIAIPTGSLIFLADLIRQLPMLMRVRLITVTSYPGKATASQGAKIEGQIPDDLAGHHVLVVDDILDSGNTIRLVQERIGQQKPASVRVCVLLRKRIPTAMALRPDYVGFDIDDEFVVGYGLDYDGYYRNLPDVVALKPEVLS